MHAPAVIAHWREMNTASRRFAWRGACHSTSRRALRLALGGMLVLGWSAVARAEWLFDIDAGARYDSNLTRAQERPDVRGDAAATLFASGGTFFALTGADGLTLYVNALTEAWHRFHGLNRASIGGSASYKHKFGLGYAAPWISLGLAGSHDNYRSAIRDSDSLEARAELGQRFTEAFDASVGAVFDRRYARNDLPVVPGISGKVFDVRGKSTTQTAAVTLSWALSDRSSLNFRYADERTSAYEGLDYRGRIAALSFAFGYW